MRGVPLSPFSATFLEDAQKPTLAAFQCSFTAWRFVLWVGTYVFGHDAWGTPTRGDPSPSSTYCSCSRFALLVVKNKECRLFVSGGLPLPWHSPDPLAHTPNPIPPAIEKRIKLLNHPWLRRPIIRAQAPPKTTYLLIDPRGACVVLGL